MSKTCSNIVFLNKKDIPINNDKKNQTFKPLSIYGSYNLLSLFNIFTFFLRDILNSFQELFLYMDHRLDHHY